MPHIIQKKCTLLQALSTFYPDSSKRTLLNWITYNRVQVEGKVIKKPHFQVDKGQHITILKKNLMPFPLVYKDPHLMIIDKPFNLLSVPKDHTYEKNALDIVKNTLSHEEIYCVHRLDQKTSGLLIFAKTKPAAKALSLSFKSHTIKRTYYAVCEGVIDKSTGTIRSYLIEDKNLQMRSVQDRSKGKEAITHYQVIKRTSYTTHLLLHLETGKKHQIRLHLKEMGHPVLADKRYGSLHDPIKRLCLHATKLSFLHPITQEPMEFTSTVPSSFTKL